MRHIQRHAEKLENEIVRRKSVLHALAPDIDINAVLKLDMSNPSDVLAGVLRKETHVASWP